jgi:hypothetical protein
MATPKHEIAAPKPPLKFVNIVRRPGFVPGISFTFKGQQMTPMTVSESEAFAEGEFEPEPLSEFVEIDLTIPPLSFALMREHKDQLERVTGNTDVWSFEALVTMVLYALSRNYRGVPRWLVEQSLDISNMPEFTQAFMDVSGLKRKEAEAKKAMAAASKKPTGTESPA